VLAIGNPFALDRTLTTGIGVGSGADAAAYSSSLYDLNSSCSALPRY
jgi:S1-C subfamily serine protease